ncbi:MAG TPA: hypothetical protein VFQ61_05675 [Polyangiaceae bacterium]|nr:hypothetical protein [Polyangiaceae bacterium]
MLVWSSVERLTVGIEELERQRLWDAAQVPWEVLDYERWIAQVSATPTDDYLFSSAKARFEAADSDRLLALVDVEIQGPASAPKLYSKSLAVSLSLSGLSRQNAEQCLLALRSNRTVAELRSELPSMDAFLTQTLGLLVFAPEALTELEARVPGTELVRFVGTPYEIVRAYWENAADVRVLAEDILSGVRDGASFLESLRALHVVTLMGRRLDRFYCPASKVARAGVRPGMLFAASTALQSTARDLLLLSGPRVGAPYVGGARYHELLTWGLVARADRANSSATASCPPQPSRHDQSGHVSDWGRVIRARAPHEASVESWFIPPRPMTSSHFDALWSAYAEATQASRRADTPGLYDALARFHYRFARLHPFRCANQSLSMNLVNALLQSTGGGIPHLLLDHVAFHVDEPAYACVFQRAVKHHRLITGSAPPNPSQRWQFLRQRKQQSYALVEKIQKANSLEHAKQICKADPTGSEAALIDLNALA